MIGLVAEIFLLLTVAYAIGVSTGAFPLPIGFDRGKVKWLRWCGTGGHFHTVYWTPDHGFQSLHPADRGEGP